MTPQAPSARHPGAALALAMFVACSSAACVVAGATMPPPASAQAMQPQAMQPQAMQVDDGYFYANLAPDGEWFYQAEFGWVWHPTRVDAGWRPYTDGQWLWSDDSGWVWATDERWGWATYHYGRWYFDPIHAWSWVPGRTWAPAWVSWRIEDGYVGWAPLWPAYFDVHPEYRWDRWAHDGEWNRRHGGRDWDRWVFTRDRDFASDHVGRYALRDRGERDRVFRSSRDVTQWDGNHPEKLGRGVDRRRIEKATGRPLRSVTLEQADRPGAQRDSGPDRLRVFRPRVQESRDKTPDRLGFAKEPTKAARETDTIRSEKSRLDRSSSTEGKRGKDATVPAVREKPEHRGAVVEPRREPAAKPEARRPSPDREPRQPAAEREPRQPSPQRETRKPAEDREQRQPAAQPEPRQRDAERAKPQGRVQPQPAAPAPPQPAAPAPQASPRREDSPPAVKEDRAPHAKPEKKPKPDEDKPVEELR